MERHDLSTHDADPQEEIARLTAMMGYEENMQRAEEEHYDNEPNYAWELLPETIGRLVQRLRGVEAQLGVDENGETLADRYRVAMENAHLEVDRLAAELRFVTGAFRQSVQDYDAIRERNAQLTDELAVSRKWARRWKAKATFIHHLAESRGKRLESAVKFANRTHAELAAAVAYHEDYVQAIDWALGHPRMDDVPLKDDHLRAIAALKMYGMMWEQAERENAALKALCREGAHNVGNYANYAHALQVQSMRVGDSSAARRWQSVENEARNVVSRLEAAGKEE